MPELPSRSKVAVPGLSCFAAVVAIYLPGAVRRSAWSDDIPWLEGADFSISYAVGRPVYALAYSALFPSTVDGLVLLRSLGVFGIATLSATIAIILARWRVPPITATLWAIAAVLLPAFHSYAGWASAFLMPWAAVLGVLSGLLWLEAVDHRQLVWRCLAFIGLTIALLSYPPSAMFCWVYLGLRILVLRTPPRPAFRQILSMGCLTSLSGGVFLLTATIVRHIREIPSSHRFEIVNSLPEIFDKLVWFATRPVVIAARPFLITSPNRFEAILTGGFILVCVLIGLLLRHQGNVFERLWSLCIYTITLSLTMLSHLLGIENQIEYRFMAGISVLMFSYICVAGSEIIKAILSNIGQHRLRSLSNFSKAVFLSITILIGIILATTNINRVFIKPSAEKERFLQNALTDFNSDLYSRVIVISDPAFYPSRPHLGVYSTVTDLAHPWVPEANIKLILREFHEMETPTRVLVVPNETSELLPTDFLIDLRPYADSLRG